MTDQQTDGEMLQPFRSERTDDTDTCESATNDETVETPTVDEPANGSVTDEPDTFPREYVEQLRKEAADARVKVKDRDALAERLHVALVAATGRLADPTDLPYDPAHIDDDDALTAAIDALVERKPHLASRRIVGQIGQGATTGAEPVSLAGILRANAN